MNEIVPKSEIAILLAGTAAVESICANYFPAGLHLDLPLVFTVYIGWHSSSTRGATCGLAFGWLQDAIFGIFLGLNGVSKTILGFAAPQLNRWLVLEHFPGRVALLVALSSVDDGVWLGLSALLGQPIPPGIGAHTAIEAVVTAGAGATIFHLYDRVKFPRKDFRRL